MINGNCSFERILEKFKYIPSLLRRGLFVLWGGFCVVRRLGRKKKRARGAQWEGGKFPSSPARFLFFRLLIFWWGSPAVASAEERDIYRKSDISFVSICALWISSVDTCNANCLQCTPTFWHSQKGFKRFWKFLKAGIAVCWSFPRFFQSPFPVSAG